MHLVNETNKNIEAVPFDQAYWVVPEKLLAGCYPGSDIRARAQHQLKALLKNGIRYVINLMDIGELRRNTSTHHLASPETGQQIDLVTSWVEGE
jgi:hypothetical protein